MAKRLTEAEAKRVLRGHNFEWHNDLQRWKCVHCGFEMRPYDPHFSCNPDNDPSMLPPPEDTPFITADGTQVLDVGEHVKPLPHPDDGPRTPRALPEGPKPLPLPGEADAER